MKKHYEFLLNGEAIDLRQAVDAVGGDPHVTLLQWLRATGRTGTKEGCGEGECGACAVVVRRIEAGQVLGTFEAVNSCLLPLLALEGAEVTSIEGVAPPGATRDPRRLGPNEDGDGLHPVQRALVERGGSQCGYCTPGFVMSLFTEYYRPGRDGFDPSSISGNLCRCTGYRPILEAGRGLPRPEASDPRLAELRRPARAALSVVYEHSGRHFIRPTSWEELWDALDRFPEHTLIHGGTDLMVYANQRHRRYPVLISLEGLAELRELRFAENLMSLGAGAALSRIEGWLAAEHAGLLPALEQLLPLFSSRAIRNRATLGGNLATASPIGDSAPVLLMLGAELVLRKRGSERRVPLSEFFTGYRRTLLDHGELIFAVRIPAPSHDWQRFYKVSKRVCDDISTVSAAFGLSLDAGRRVRSLRVAFGGVAATPLLATPLTAAAAGQPWDAATLAILLEELGSLGTPQTDVRGSADYRRAMMGQLLRQFFHESQGPAELTQVAANDTRGAP